MQFLETSWTYAAILLVSIGGLMLCDRRWKLVAFRNKNAQKATLLTILVLLALFLAWDIAGILLGIFYTNPRYTLGLNIVTPNLPIEEVFFLILLIYSVLIIDAATKRHYIARHKK
jgi:lycopene cyclase domain-containing protein